LRLTESITRRKKCDEVAPQCGECRRLEIANCQGKSTASFRQAPLTNIPAVSQFDGDGNDLLGQDLNDVADSALDTSEYLSRVALMPESDIAEMARRGHLKDSNALRGQERDQDLQNNPILKNFPRVSHWDFTDWDPVEQYLLSHFLEVVSRSFVVVFDDENPFLNDILPKASNIRSVRHALLALTACHLCKLYPNFEDSVVKHQTLALFFLKKDLEFANDIENTLVVSLLLCLFEVGLLHSVYI
jgi:transcriptional activator protein UGA3